MLAYDSSPDNDLNVPIVCMACTSGSINSPTATSSDPVRQAALRNSNHWNFRPWDEPNPQANVLPQVATPAAAHPARWRGRMSNPPGCNHRTHNGGKGSWQSRVVRRRNARNGSWR